MTALDDVKAVHTDYEKFKRETNLIKMMMDEHETKRSCVESKGGAGSYLLMPLALRRDDKEKEGLLYESYVDHAYLPEDIVVDAAQEMVGICFKTKPIINLPGKIKHLEAHANARGDSLVAVANDLISEIIKTRRVAISTDYNADEDKAVIAHRASNTLINWRTGSGGYTMMVFSENYNNGEEKEQRRHYSIEEGDLVVTVFRELENGEWAEHKEVDENGGEIPQPSLSKGKPYDFIPIRIADTSKPALLGMARTVWKGFKVSADYYGTLHKFTTTLVLKTDETVERLKIGFENGIKVGTSGDAKLLQPTTDGAAPQKNAMDDLFDSAVDQGVRLISVSSAAESGNALYQRNANKQIKMDYVADIVSREVTESLRVAAILEGENPDEVVFKLKVELIENPVNVEELKEMREAVVDAGLVKWSDYLLKLESSNLITLDRLPDGGLDTKKYIGEAIDQAKTLNTEPEAI